MYVDDDVHARIIRPDLWSGCRPALASLDDIVGDRPIETDRYDVPINGHYIYSYLGQTLVHDVSMSSAHNRCLRFPRLDDIENKLLV
jgi:hypothetical protein